MQIKFSHPYRKLRHPCFTTVRRWTPEKERYYRGGIGKALDVLIEGRPFPVGQAVLSFVGRVPVSDLPPEFLAYDTDDGLYRLNPRMDALLLVFVSPEPLVME